MNIKSYREFNYTKLSSRRVQKRKTGNPGNKRKDKYKDLISAFDIETTGIPEIEQSIMYIWQWCFYYSSDDYEIVVGRTWEEFIDFCIRLKRALKGKKLVCYVHNLSYEFVYLSGIYNFLEEDVFCMDSRKVLKATLYDCIEMRCSYIHSNMKLENFTKKYGAKHSKLSGEEFNYEKRRYWYTPLTEKELAYCINDVLGLCEALDNEMKSDGDNLYSIPLTSTGYVRREVKKVMQPYRYFLIQQLYPSLELYMLLRESFRGGDTFANRYYVDKIVDAATYAALHAMEEAWQRLHSADRSSSYLFEIVNSLLPMSAFVKAEYVTSIDDVITLMRKNKAVLFRVKLWNVRLKNRLTGNPYIPVAKCSSLINAVKANGRVLQADYLEMVINDIDLHILLDQYEFSSDAVSDCWFARYGKLPKPLRDLVTYYYQQKTALKTDDPESDNFILYNKMKSRANSTYGLMVQKVLRDDIVYRDGDFRLKHENETPEERIKRYKEELEKDKKKAFLVYQWGCWITARARLALHKGADCATNAGADPGRLLYGDTDSVKYMGDADFTEYNEWCIRKCKESGAYATDPKGKVHYMGVFEPEEDMLQFATMGAKKYAYVDTKGKLHITIAGVSKKDGAKELESKGGLAAFKEGLVFKLAGGLEAVYNDDTDMDWINEDGKKIHITRNLYLKPSTYTLGITADFRRVLEGIERTRYEF